jgi:hypothetical protein
MTKLPISAGTIATNIACVLLGCGGIAAGVMKVALLNQTGERLNWRPPAQVELRTVEGRFEQDTLTTAYRSGYRFTTTDGRLMYMRCRHDTGSKYAPAVYNGCLGYIPEDLRGQVVRVGYFDPVFKNGEVMGDHLILKVWRGERLLLIRRLQYTG